MSTIKQKIASDFMTAFKMGAEGRDKKNILGFLKSQISLKEQEKGRTPGDANDDEVMAVIKKSVKNLNETIDMSGDNQEAIEKAKFEIGILEVYLPVQMSEADIDVKIKEAIDGGANNMGQIMAAFSGLGVDKGLVSQKAKQLINSK